MRQQFSLRLAILVVTLVAVASSGAFTNPITLVLALFGLILLWAGMDSQGGLALGMVAGVGWIGMAAVIDYLLQLPHAP